MKLHEVVELTARSALELQNDDGSMPSGHNGPWNDPETPVRNTGHWLITFVKAYEITGSKIFLDAAHRAADYLCSADARPLGAAFWHRKNPNKDSSNGLIGQAWTIEALATGSARLGRPELSQLAEDLFFQHPFNSSTGLWSTINVNGTEGKLDRTLNHQIWFAASGSLLLHQNGISKEINIRVFTFLDHLHNYLHFNDQGIITHIFEEPYSGDTHWKMRFKHIFPHKHQKHIKTYLGIGYHSFNLYGLALLRIAHPSHPIWLNHQLQSMWAPIETGQFNQIAQNNPYCFTYNPSGIEIAFSLHVFRPDSTDLIVNYLSNQFSKSFNFQSGFMEHGEPADPVTLAARFYEATRLPDYPIKA